MNAPAASLLEALGGLTDPRHRRGVRHPFAGLVALTLLGLVCRQADFASIARWARRHWDALRGPLGFTRDYAPHATTIERAAATYSVAELRAALARWLADGDGAGAAAVDGKVSRQARDGADPIRVLNVFAHDAKLCLADWPVGAPGEATEPDALRAHLGELLAAYPGLRILTGDAAYCTRPLAAAIVEAGRDYVLAVKANQPELREAAVAAFAAPGGPAAEAREKKGGA